MIGPDGRMIAAGFEGLAQEEADARVVAWLKEHDAAREAGALPAFRRHLRALSLADRAARLAAVVVPDGRAGGACDRGVAGAPRPVPPREPAPVRDRVARARTRTGASRDSSGGATRSRSGRAPTGIRRARGRRPRLRRVRIGRARAREPTSSTPGSRRRCGRLRRSAGPSGRPSSSATTRATST